MLNEVVSNTLTRPDPSGVNPPVTRRTILLWVGVGAWFACLLAGSRRVDAYGRLTGIGVVISVFGFVALTAGLFLFVLTGYRWSWGWLL